MSLETRSGATDRVAPAGRATKGLAWSLASAAVAFAIVNLQFEATGRFEQGPLSEYASGLTIVNWFVAALKVIGAAIAVQSVYRQTWISPRLVNLLMWGAAGTLGVYALGSVAQAIGLATGVVGSTDQIDLGGIGYVVAFVLAAAGFAVLAMSHSRRSGLGKGLAILGSIGGVILLGIILVAIPAVLSALGVMPST